MNDEVISDHSKQIGDLRLRIVQDSCPTSPREDDNLGTFLAWHNRYNLGDPDSKNFNPKDYDGWDELQKAIELELDPVIMKPVFMMDHSGLTLRTRDFGDCGMYGYFDSGRLGFILVDRKTALKEFGEITQEVLEKLDRLLESEIKTYQQYLDGDIWGFSLVKRTKCGECGHEEWETLDSCYGFYGDDPMKNGMKDCIEGKYWLALFGCEKCKHWNPEKSQCEATEFRECGPGCGPEAQQAGGN